MITSLNLTLSELKQLFTEILLNKTNKISDIGDDSVLNGIAFGVAKVSQKAIKDIAIVETQIFPKTATGEYLDSSAKLFGVKERRGALGSSTYLRVIADEGTRYLKNVNYFVNTNGVRFELEEDFIIGSLGYGYVKVRSIGSGEKTNVLPNSITTVAPIPSGHNKVTNEYVATGGSDSETDEVFRLRILNNLNVLSVSTLEYFNQVLQSIDDRILKIINLGRDDLGKIIFGIVTQNGVDLTSEELSNLLQNSKEYFSITDLNQFGDNINIIFQNIEWHEVGGEVGIDFRVEIDNSYVIDDVRKNIQISLSKEIDFRFWDSLTDKIEWDNLLDIVKKTEGVKYVPDEFFYPNKDEKVVWNKLPRIKSFKMRDLEGNIIFDSLGVLSPIFYSV